jgi:hypothetical protein
MDKQTRNGVLGVVFLGIGVGLAVAGVTLAVPVCVGWSRSKLNDAYRKGKAGLLAGIETATDTLSEAANKAQQPLGEAAKAARYTTAVAAGAIESAAHYVKERVQ